MTNEACRAMSVAAGFLYYGTSKGRDCWADNALAPGAAAAGADECQAPCAGNGTDACGGSAGQVSVFARPYGERGGWAAIAKHLTD